MDKLSIIVDFDGTCTTHSFPEIGHDIGAAPVLTDIVKAGHRLILFTMRSDRNSNGPTNDPAIHDVTGDFLKQAVEWFERNNIPLYGIQKCPNQHTWTTSPKAYGQVIIDDCALGIPLITWEKNSSNWPGLSFKAITTHLPGMMLPNLPYHNRPYVDWGNTRVLLEQMNIL